jgi:uncharacterized repeat protein (TIGR03806 family)
MRKSRTLISTTFLLASALAFISCKSSPARPPLVPKPPTAATAGPQYLCQWTDQPITIDGNANEPAWQNAPLIDHFVIPWQGPDKRPHNATRAKLLWDRENLYFFADMDDADLYADVTQHNGKVWENDAFEMFLKPAADKPGYYEFEVSPLNTTFDIYFPKRGAGPLADLGKAHPFKFETAVALRGSVNGHQDQGGWSVEGRVRWADLASTGGRPAVDETWRFSLCRVDFKSKGATADLSTIASMKTPDFHHHEDYPLVRFAGPTASAEKPFGIDHRTPWLNSHLVGYPEPPPPYTIVKAFPHLEKIFQPLFITEEPGKDDLLIIQHLGAWAGPAKIIRVKNDPAASSTDTIYEAHDITYCLIFHPKYRENGYLYIASNGPLGSPNPRDRICRYTMDRKTGKPDLASKLPIIEWDSNGHNGAAMAFGPDGMLYITSGDTSTDSDRNNRGQDLTHLSSALLRIDVDHPDAGKNYSVPKDNPFVGQPQFKDARPEIWAHGFRNPWRMTIDDKTGTIWVTQNGQDLWEQVYAVRKGANYGWPVYEGSHPFHPYRKLEKRTTYTPPTLEHSHSEARSLTGGIVYYGAKYPDLQGAYLYGDFSTGRIWAAKYDGTKITWHQEIARTPAQIVNFYADKHGDIFICDDSGGIWKLAPRPKDAPTPQFPRLLSQTGLFTNTAAHQPDPGLIPYDVNSPLWSDNAKKQRFIALPDDARIDYTASHGWNFPEGSALVKTFSLDLEEGNPASRRRLETRVILKQGANWTGYTYIWNDAQTDAELAPAAGKDQTFTIKDPAAPLGLRKQTWHYPSRAECLVCHSRAANFVLGPSEAQMNRTFNYGAHQDNQLRTLEHLGVLKTDFASTAHEQLVKDARASGLSAEQADKFAGKLEDTTGQRQSPKEATLLPHPPVELTHLVSPADTSQSLNLRARSYLHANCAHCHVEAGGGNASVDLDFFTDAPRTKMFNIPAQSNLGTPGAKLIAMGHPNESVVLQRIATRGTGQMPPLGSNVVDQAAVKLLNEWIAKMPASTQPTK